MKKDIAFDDDHLVADGQTEEEIFNPDDFDPDDWARVPIPAEVEAAAEEAVQIYGNSDDRAQIWIDAVDTARENLQTAIRKEVKESKQLNP